MNDPRPKDFEAHLCRVIDSIAARPDRKRIMREELLGHLLECHQAELSRGSNERAAVQAAIERLGSVDELRMQLQASVPFFERMLFACLNRKETLMSRWLWIVAVAGFVAGLSVGFPHHEQFTLGCAVLLCGLGLGHLFQQRNVPPRRIGPRLLAPVGCFVILVGNGVVLPAMAKIKHDGTFGALALENVAMGALIALSGLGFVAFAIRTFRARPT
ncbi:MAG: permease prefix domain 1-containing protein [Tepidisphaeraceae bacterium]|jgi:hypothetical protein